MQTIGAMTMPGGFDNRGRPTEYEEAMVSRNVHLPQFMWDYIDKKANERKVKEKRKRVGAAEIIRDFVVLGKSAEVEPGEILYDIPVVGVLLGGANGSIQAMPTSTFVSVSKKYPDNSQVLLVAGQPMETEEGISIPDGHYALFVPQEKTPPGALVLAQWFVAGVKTHAFKKFVPRTDGGAIFHPLNSSKDAPPVEMKMGEFEILGTFTESLGDSTPERTE